MRELGERVGVGVDVVTPTPPSFPAAPTGYQLVRRRGRGGFAEVWEAIAPGGFRVALKLVVPAVKTRSGELRAIDIIRGIRHPHLLPTFGAWEVDDRLVIGMELADRSLDERYHEARSAGLCGIPRQELLGYLSDAAAGVDYLNGSLHLVDGRPGRGVQHRDLKPQNILLVGGRAKVADFGMVRVMEQSVVSHTGAWTLPYAAPEFFRGQTARQSDQYGLAVSYCQLRGGRLPFRGTAAEIMSGHLLSDPDLSALPPPERPIVARALSKDPEARWPHCQSFIDALRSLDSTDGEGLPEVLYPTNPGVDDLFEVPILGSGEDCPSFIAIGSGSGVDLSQSSIVTGNLPGLVLGGSAASDEEQTEIRDSEPTPFPSSPPSSMVFQCAGPMDVESTSTLGVDLASIPGGSDNAWASELPISESGPAPIVRSRVRSRMVAATFMVGLILAALVTRIPQTPQSPLAHAIPPTPTPWPDKTLKTFDTTSQAISLPVDDAVHTQGPETIRTAIQTDEPERPTSRTEGEPEARDADEIADVPSPSVTVLKPVLPAIQKPTLELPESIRLRAGEQAPMHIRMQGGTVEGPQPLVFHDLPPGVTVACAPLSDRQGEADAVVSVARDVSPANSEVSVAFAAEPDRTVSRFHLVVLPSMVVDAYERGRGALHNGDYHGSIAAMNEVLRLDPKHEGSHFLRGMAQHLIGQYASALSDYTEAIRRQPDHAEAHLLRARVHQKLGALDEAMTDLDAAIRSRPKDPVAFAVRGRLHHERGAYDKALADLSEAIRLRPDDAATYYRRGLVRYHVGNLAGSIADFTEAIRLDPNYAKAYHARSEAFARSGDRVRATADRDAYDKIISARPAEDPADRSATRTPSVPQS